MPTKLDNSQLAERVRWLQSGLWNEEEAERIFYEIGENVPCPPSNIQDYIFHSEDGLDAETIVERMLLYKPIIL